MAQTIQLKGRDCQNALRKLFCCLLKIHFKFKDMNRFKVKG